MAANTLNRPLNEHVRMLPDVWQRVFAAPDVQAALPPLSGFLEQRLAEGVEIYPHAPLRALDYVYPAGVKVIILGQDPYHGPDQAQGLAFSVPDSCRCPPSLRNILQELACNYPQAPARTTHELSAWARQGVLLLNAVLTVEAGKPGSHAGKGWETITDAILRAVARSPQPKVALLWGAWAQRKSTLLQEHAAGPLHILMANHPSPLSARRPPRPFAGCGHFRAANEWLAEHGSEPIDWIAATEQR